MFFTDRFDGRFQLWPGGNDEIHGGGGNDSLSRHRGNDLIWGDEGDDTIFGGEGDDTLFAVAGDFAERRDGADTFVLKPVDGSVPVIADYSYDEDQLLLHLPESMADDAQIGLHQDQDDTWLVTVNDAPVGRLLHLGGLRIEDIGILRIPG